LDYLTFNALGVAILRANEEAAVAQWMPKGFAHGGRRRSVLLIDEIDKAPRDFPNDILNEVEGMYFKIAELGNVTIAAEESLRPVLILTSNSEKNLPDAFLRRCVYYNIPFPDKERLIDIINARVGRLKHGDPLLTDAVDLFSQLREPNSGLIKKPATAELLGWLTFLSETVPDGNDSLRRHRTLLLSSLGVLVKNSQDQRTAKAITNDWLGKQ
jgi:MoxR-like ATPase